MKVSKILLSSVLLLHFNAIADDSHNLRKHSARAVEEDKGALESKSIVDVDTIQHIFVDGKLSGQLRSMYGSYKNKGATDTYATAVGGILKYELADYKGFNAGAALYLSKDISFATGNGAKQNNELSSTDGSYTDLAEAYVNYSHDDLNIRVGRQTLDTPLADSDDIRMIQDTFNAFTLAYVYEGIDFLAGHIVSWQGIDAGLDAGWSRVAEPTHGTTFGGLSYQHQLELQLWYYNMSQQSNALYLEFGGHYDFTDNALVHGMVQYLHETQLENSGLGAEIYGAMFELMAYDVSLNFAYDKSKRKKGLASFSGIGGGTLFTSMDTMILDNITADRDADAYVAGITYSYDDVNFLYAYGDFKGKADGTGAKAHVLEQDISIEYNYSDELLFSFLYVLSEDKEATFYTDTDYNRIQVMINYNF